MFGADAGLLPSDRSLAFVQNHDTERNGSTLSYKDGATNTLATEFMLAYGYGTPQVYSGFAFADTTIPRRRTPTASSPTPTAPNGWACTDRSRASRTWSTGTTTPATRPVRNWCDDGSNLIAFSRGDRAWIAINNDLTAQTHTFTTGLPTGTYCDVIHGTFSGPTAATAPVRRSPWAEHGTATVTVPAKDSVAFDAGDLVRR